MSPVFEDKTRRRERNNEEIFLFNLEKSFIL